MPSEIAPTTQGQFLIFGREPAVVFAALSALLGLIVASGVTGLTTDQAGALTVAASAVFAAIVAAFSRPITPTAFVGAFTAAATALAAFHFNLSPEFIGAGNGFITAVLLYINRGHITPTTIRGQVIASRKVW